MQATISITGVARAPSPAEATKKTSVILGEIATPPAVQAELEVGAGLYLPKGMGFSALSQRYLTQIATALSTRSRKRLSFLTPEEVLSAEINQLTSRLALKT